MTGSFESHVGTPGGVHIAVVYHIADYAAFCEAMDSAVEDKVHIHCAANYRVSAFYSLYAQSRGLWGDDEAQAFIEDLWAPAEYPVWLNFIRTIRGNPGKGRKLVHPPFIG
ncbi:protein-tyrosine phosphatase family protein [Kineobactrum salinum]|uniref:Phosphatase n=1 Tax=Kineobactrum salinum TaxID=2708301 RepID=A0A6C0U6D7_9GAMM|nr:hypothetical protein [Kineobactrum salinum]QIB66497.1 hypothetical protein G3T16_14920 [Kineobactrum salinum]